MDNQFSVFFIYAHTESGSRNDDLNFIFNKRFLIGYFFGRFHLSVKRFCAESVFGKFFGERQRSFRS